jgi:hypothetical protein
VIVRSSRRQFVLAWLTLAGVSLEVPLRADNCNPDNLSDCEAAPPNITGTLGAAGVLTGLGLLNGMSGGGGEGSGETPGGASSSDSSGSFLDDL